MSDHEPYGPVQEQEEVPSVETHQPGHDDDSALGPREVEGDPPDVVGGRDDRSGGPAERAPDPPER